MKIICKKSFLQIRRDVIMLVLTLVCAPFFVLLYKLIFLEGMTLYNTAVLSKNLKIEEEFLEELGNQVYPGGGRLFNFINVDSMDEGLDMLYKHRIKVLISINSLREVKIYGNFSDPYFVLSSTLLEKGLTEYIYKKLNKSPLIEISKIPLGKSISKTEFESYIPGLIIFSILIQIYLFSLILLKEKESGVFLRYRLCGINKLSYIAGHSLIFFLISLLGIILTLTTSIVLGFKSYNSFISDFSVTLLTAVLLNFSVIGLSFIISTLTCSVIHGLLLTTFPFMFMVFFSGSVYPFPQLALFNIIPATHAVSILTKVFTYGLTIGDFYMELIYMMLLSVLIFLVGVKRVTLVM